MDAWKVELGKKALELGILNDPHWLERLDDPIAVWAVLELVVRMMEKIDPPSVSYD